jgi:uncharacterized protein (TIGR03437 family)
VSKFISGLMFAICLARAATNGIVVTPAAVTVQYQLGSATLPAAQTLQVKTTPTPLPVTVAVSGAPFNAAWLLVSATQAISPLALKVSTNPTGLAAGTYTGAITFTAMSGGLPLTQTTTVTLVVTSAPASISTTPGALNFNYVTGGPIPSASLSSAFIVSSNGGALSATIAVAGAPWLTVTPTGGISLVGLFDTVAVTVNPTGLAPKVYTGTITITAPASINKSVTIAVGLTVAAAPPQTVSTWPLGLIKGSGSSIVTIYGSNFFPNSTAATTGFTPATTVTVNDGATAVSDTFLIPVYQSTATGLRLSLASPLPSGIVSVPFSRPFFASGGTAPYNFVQVGGLLPPGLSIGANSISGTPTSAGTFLFTMQVTDTSAIPVQAYRQLQLTVGPVGSLQLSLSAPWPFADGIMGAAYGPYILGAAGGTGGPYVWSATNLPPGLVLSPAGILSGTPITDGGAGPLVVTPVSTTALLATIPISDLGASGILRVAVTTPAPGGGVSNEAQFQIYGPEPQISAVVSSASYLQGTLAPGDVIAIFGLGLGPAALTIFDPSAPPIPTALPTLAPSTSVTINGTPVPLIYTSGTVVGAVVPYTLAGASAQVVVTYGGLTSLPFTVSVVASDPGIYSIASSGQGEGAILDFNATTGDFSVNSVANAAPRGSIVVMYITGAGATTSIVDNLLIPFPPAAAVTPLAMPTVTIGGQSATVLAAQAPPGSIPGLIQLNVVVPMTVAAGPALPIVVTVGAIPSPAGLTMAVK